MATTDAISSTPWYWWVIGFGGQAAFSARFLVQWISSERAKESVIPVAFWYLSLVGGVLLLAYAIFRVDPVFIVAQATGAVIYTRNLQLLTKRRDAGSNGTSADAGDATPSPGPETRGPTSTEPPRVLEPLGSTPSNESHGTSSGDRLPLP